MEIIKTTAEKLLDDINSVGSCIPPKPSIPILKTLLFENKEGLKVTADNLEMRTTISCNDIEVLQEFNFCVDFEMLKRVLMGLDEQPITVSLLSGRIKIETIFAEYEIPVEDAKAFPTPQPQEFSEEIKIEDDNLFNAIRKASTFVDSDASTTISSVMIYIGEYLKVVGLSHHNFYEETIKKIDREPKKLLVSKDVCKYIVSLEKSFSGFTIRYNTTHVRIETDELTVLAIQKEGKFPDYEKVFDSVPKENKFICKPYELKPSIRRFDNIAFDIYKSLRFEFSKDKIHMKFNNRNNDMKGDEDVKIDYNGKEIIYAFNVSFFHSNLNCFDENEEIDVIVNGEKTPILFMGKSIKILLAPMALDY